ncbi:MAG: hypothetical protein U1E17_06105 [Geminicoccaceae bacterium]
MTQLAALFTHVIDVRPFDDCPGPRCRAPLAAWHQSTLHHAARSWMWVIPFNNYRASTRWSASGQLNRAAGQPAGDPHDEFEALIADYPRRPGPVRRGQAGARMGDLEPAAIYLAHTNVGDRWCLLSSSGFVICCSRAASPTPSRW